MSTIAAIPTEHQGILYRSRTEAKWALFLGNEGIPFRYEAEGFELDGVRYLPDFWLPDGKCWLEVKPFDPLPEEIEKAMRLAKATRRMVFIAPGAPRARIGIVAISPTGAMQTGWQFCYQHEGGVEFLVKDPWDVSVRVRIAGDGVANPHCFGIMPDSELDAAGAHQFSWKSGGRFRQTGAARRVEGRTISGHDPYARTIEPDRGRRVPVMPGRAWR